MASQYPGAFRHYRWKELGLLIIPFIILLLEATQLLLVNQFKLNPNTKIAPGTLPTVQVQALIPVLGLIAVLVATNILLSIFFSRADQVLLPLVGLLSGLGILMATRLGPSVGDLSLGTKQLIWVLLGILICIITLFILRNMDWLGRYPNIWAFLGLILVGITVVNTLIHVRNLDSPTHDQLNIGPINFQPSELLKICIVIFFAAYLSENHDILAGGSLRFGRLRLPPMRQLGPVFMMLFISLLLFLGVRELGLALLIYGIFLTMIYLGSGKLSYVVAGLLLFAFLGLVGYALFSYVRNRFIGLSINLVTPGAFDENLYQKSAYQLVQGLIALSSGGIIGSGFGLGHPGFVPVVDSDFVLTALGEELGLAGLFAIIGIYLFIIYRGFRIAIEARDSFSQLLAAGLTSIFAIQTLIIAAGNMKFFPLTGIPLPFLSYGGSSILANYIIVGILLRISRNTAMQQEGLA